MFTYVTWCALCWNTVIDNTTNCCMSWELWKDFATLLLATAKFQCVSHYFICFCTLFCCSNGEWHCIAKNKSIFTTSIRNGNPYITLHYSFAEANVCACMKRMRMLFLFVFIFIYPSPIVGNLVTIFLVTIFRIWLKQSKIFFILAFDMPFCLQCFCIFLLLFDSFPQYSMCYCKWSVAKPPLNFFLHSFHSGLVYVE